VRIFDDYSGRLDRVHCMDDPARQRSQLQRFAYRNAGTV
jgi:hypothetical protein